MCDSYGNDDFGAGVANKHCCTCGGGTDSGPTPPPAKEECTNNDGWHFTARMGGRDTKITCKHFEKYSNFCKDYGGRDFSGTGVANDNCCKCGKK